MKGLEVSEVSFSKLKVENGELRIDAEYFQKEYLNEDTSLSKIGIEKLGVYAFVTDGQHGYYEADPKSNISMLAARNCKNYFADKIDALPLAKWVDENNKRSSLQHGDIILSTRGSVGCCAIVYEEVLPANINQDVARIKLNNSNAFVPEFLITYLNCKYGQNWMMRNQTGMVQQGLPLDKVRAIPLPLLSINFQQKIETLVKSAHAKLAESKSLYAQAEDTLLCELGLKNWQPKNENINVKTFSESFLSSGRLDAEYYQSKYDEIEERIKTYKGGYFNFGETIEYIFTGEYAEEYKSKANNLIFYIRSLNMKNGRIETDDSHYVNPNEFTKVVKTGNIITARVGTIGIFAEVDGTLNNAACSDNILCFNLPKQHNPAVYTMLLNSKPIFELVDRLARGSVQQRLNQETLKDLILPILPSETQNQIAELIQTSFALRQESKRLLEEAKRMVEAEIEG